MRIGYDAKRAFHNTTGLGNYSRTLLEGMARFHPSCHYYLYTPAKFNQVGKNWFEQAKSFQHNLKVVTPQHWSGKMFPSFWRSVFLSKTIKKDSLDIFHGLSHELPPRIDRAAKRCVVTIHDLIFLRYPELFPWIDRQSYLWKFKSACDQADLVLAISQQTKIDLIQFFNIPENKIRVIYQSCNPFYYDKSFESGPVSMDQDSLFNKRPYILTVGSLVPRKNIQVLISSFSRLAQKYSDHQLVIVGRGPLEKDLRQQAKDLGLEKRIHLLSQINEAAKLKNLYSNACVFVYPSLFEGFGIPLIESLFCKTPVITSKGSCFSEAAGPGALYADPLSVDEYHQALDELLACQEKRKQLSQKGYEYVQQFRWDKTSEKLMDVYKELRT